MSTRTYTVAADYVSLDDLLADVVREQRKTALSQTWHRGWLSWESWRLWLASRSSSSLDVDVEAAEWLVNNVDGLLSNDRAGNMA
ncbi:hypothetical protein MCOR27_002582 [Pyricularia oryzae]|uniref:Uncharacterized protein n=1 Tax=Pyricularia oryzae TaxID=318829 RepID=A0A4P7NV83_PYROR|nr:hypothetical protein MCOR01_009365 [Pyricularia oryzae]KAH9437380.1 hypothetical protein MCOR02_001035 [Pyricularia oryzae]KAI6254674.1 hypothetical protein MCOR19_008826 [Pyricularia oryzae]KAI6284820.1 hypothetical protein MCOR27_002582 [Pyricularia oryzae]KAI6318784.1 hypothetical protein MCOR29_005866 [Pyricularia oryzae]